MRWRATLVAVGCVKLGPHFLSLDDFMLLKFRAFFFVPFLLTFFLLALFLLSAPLHAEVVEPVDEVLTLEDELLRIKKLVTEKEKERKALERELKAEQDTVIQEQLNQELVSTKDIIIGLREEMVALSTGGAQLYDEPPVVKSEFDWRKDLELIFEPLLDQLREISERPRVIEKLQSDILFWEKRESELAKAVENLENNIATVKNNSLKRELKALLETASSRASTAEQKLSLLRNDLEELKKESNPIWTTLGDIFSTIIVSIAIHFFLAVIIAFLVYQVVRLLSLIPIAIIAKASSGETVFAERAIVVVRVVIGFILAVMTYFVVLYSFAEWLLLVVSSLIIVGVALGLKNTFPKYFIEIKTMLNMGAIRQGERLVYNGLPWRVSRLNVHTRLHNPALHGFLRVPLENIVNSSSRPYHEDEPWFPTKVGDVVFLDDGTFGTVKRQTPDIVEMDFGDSIYTFKTALFLAKSPRNLSREGFTVYEIFGLDYQYQKDITSTMLTSYRLGLERAIKRSEFAEHNTDLVVEFNNASASSLDFKVAASFKGEAARDYYKIKRFIQKTSVDIANDKGWVIPFQQLTVHHQPVS